MYETVSCLLENSVNLGLNAISENTKVYKKVEPISENVKQLLGFTLDKVTVVKESEDSYYVEYSDNLERYMKDQAITLNEAVTNICERYAIFESDLSIIVDESCVDKIDMPALVDKYKVFKK